MTGRMGLTPKLALTVVCIDELEDALGRPPSVREVAAELDRSAGSVHHAVDRLRERGWVEASPASTAGGIRLIHRLPLPEDSGIEITGAGIAYLEAHKDGPDVDASPFEVNP